MGRSARLTVGVEPNGGAVESVRTEEWKAADRSQIGSIATSVGGALGFWEGLPYEVVVERLPSIKRPHLARKVKPSEAGHNREPRCRPRLCLGFGCPAGVGRVKV